MSRTKRFLGGVSFGYLSQLLVAVVGLWLTPFLLRYIGQHDFGLWLVGTQIMLYLGLLDVGIIGLLPRETAYATGRATKHDVVSELPEIVGRTTRIVLLQTPLVVMAGVALWLFIPEEWARLQKPLGLVILIFVVMFPTRIFQAVLQGLQDLSFLARSQIFSWALGTTVTITLIVAGLGLYSLAVGWGVTQVLLAAICWHRLRKTFPYALPAHLPPFSWQYLSSQLRSGLWVSVGQIAIVMLSGTDIIIIGKFLGPAAVVPYACTAKLISLVTNQPQMLMQAAGPGLSEIKASGARNRLADVCNSLTLSVLMISGAAFCVVLAVNQGFVQWWVGAALYGGTALTALLLMNMLLRHWLTTALYTIFCFGYERRIAVVMMLDGVVTVASSVLLVRLLGPIGAPLGAIIGILAIGLPGFLVPLARESGVTVPFLFRSLEPWLWRFVLLVIASGVVARFWLPNQFWSLTAVTLLIGTGYFVVMLPAALNSPLGTYVRPRLAAAQIRLKDLGAALAK